MVCEQKIAELERRLGRKLTAKEKKAVQEKLHHSEAYNHSHEEEPICA